MLHALFIFCFAFNFCFILSIGDSVSDISRSSTNSGYRKARRTKPLMLPILTQLPRDCKFRVLFLTNCLFFSSILFRFFF